MKLTDQPHHRLTIKELSPDELSVFIEGIRQRRLEPVRIYREAQELKNQYRMNKTKAKLDRKMAVFNKAQGVADKAVARLEKLSFEIKALLFQLTELDGVPNEETGHTNTSAEGESTEGS
jgi:hypothetical protein